MKALYYRLKYLLTANIVDTHLHQYERIAALEVYVKDLKWALGRLGFDPKVHGFPPDPTPKAPATCEHGCVDGVIVPKLNAAITSGLLSGDPYRCPNPACHGKQAHDKKEE